MESKIIKSFFTGEISDELIRTPKTREYEDLNRRETAVYDKLRPMLTGETLKLFDEFVDLYGERQGMDEEDYYIRGFKFGVRLAVECFDFSDINKRDE